MKIVFMGTPEFAVPCLKRLIEDGHEICAVITQPDKPKGRGNKITLPPIKEFAINQNIRVIQPLSVKTDEFLEELRGISAEVFVTVAYGKILTKEILEIPRYGCINVHASLLPHLRGAAPIQWSIINGDKVTGITTMLTDVGLDTGDILLKEVVEITVDMTSAQLHDIMSEVGANVLSKTLNMLSKGEIKPVPQEHHLSTYAPMIKKELGKIDWNIEAKRIHDIVRGLNPWPSAYTTYCGQRIRIWKTKFENRESVELQGNDDLKESDALLASVKKAPGTILEVGKAGLLVATGDGTLRILEIQFDSSRRMSVEEYLCGHGIHEGEIFGKEG